MTYLPALFRRLARDDKGFALVEFATVLPFLILLWLGGYQLSDALTAYRKVTIATRTIADLTSQYATVDDADLDTILNASQQVMAPYAQSNARMIVAQIKVDGSGNATVDWSRGKNVDPFEKGAAFNVPASIKQNNTSIIVAQITYTYTPTVASSLIGEIPLRDQIIMSPRVADTIGRKT